MLVQLNTMISSPSVPVIRKVTHSNEEPSPPSLDKVVRIKINENINSHRGWSHGYPEPYKVKPRPMCFLTLCLCV